MATASNQRFTQGRLPKITATIGEVNVPVTAVTLTHSLNALPYAEFTVALDNAPAPGGVPTSGGVQIDVAKIDQLGKIMQEKIYNSFTLNPDVIINVTAGNADSPGDQLTFTGFLSNPAFQVAAGQFLMVFSAVHSMTRLQAFNPSIYGWYAMYDQPDQEDPFGAFFNGAASNQKTDSISKRALTGIEGLMDTFTNQRSGTQDITSAAFTAEQANPSLYEPVQWNVHALNKTVLKVVQQVLTTSAPLTEISGLTVTENGVTKPNQSFYDAPLHKTLCDVITGSANMLDAMLGICAPFLFQLNAQWGDNCWLEHIQPMAPPQSMITVPVESLAFDLASAYELPLLQVIVRGPGTEFYNSNISSAISSVAPMAPALVAPNVSDAELLYDQSMNMFGRYPAQVPLGVAGKQYYAMPGRYMYVDAPSWVCGDFQQLLPLFSNTPGEKVDLTAANLTDIAKQQRQYTGQAKARIPFLDYLARHVFNDMFLSRATARVRIPLCLTVQVGRTYFVRAAGQATSIYIGYLESVIHTVRLENDGCTATTDLVFSHVRSRTAMLTPLSLGQAAEGINTAETIAELQTLEDQLSKLTASGVTTPY